MEYSNVFDKCCEAFCARGNCRNHGNCVCDTWFQFEGVTPTEEEAVEVIHKAFESHVEDPCYPCMNTFSCVGDFFEFAAQYGEALTTMKKPTAIRKLINHYLAETRKPLPADVVMLVSDIEIKLKGFENADEFLASINDLGFEAERTRIEDGYGYKITLKKGE